MSLLFAINGRAMQLELRHKRMARNEFRQIGRGQITECCGSRRNLDFYSKSSGKLRVWDREGHDEVSPLK